MAPKTYYDILGVDPSADAKEIRRAYLRMSLKHHPDKNPNNVEEAKARFVEIGQAHATLSDERLRAQYDAALRREQQRGTFRASSTTRNNNYENTFHGSRSPPSPQSYDNYRDAFDETVAGLSEAELAAAMGVLSAVGSLVGSVVGSRLGNSTGSRLLGAAGSLAGSILASQMTGDAVRTLHQESVARVAYKREYQACVERGVPPPEPPPKSQWTQALEQTMAAVQGSLGGNVTSNSNNNSSASRSSPYGAGGTTQGNTGTSSTQQSWQDRMREQVDTAQKMAAAAAAMGAATSMWQNAMNQGTQQSQNTRRNQY